MDLVRLDAAAKGWFSSGGIGKGWGADELLGGERNPLRKARCDLFSYPPLDRDTALDGVNISLMLFERKAMLLLFIGPRCRPVCFVST